MAECRKYSGGAPRVKLPLNEAVTCAGLGGRFAASAELPASRLLEAHYDAIAAS